MILSFYVIPWVSVISTLILDVSHAVEVLVFVFMFAGGVRCHTSIVFLIQ